MTSDDVAFMHYNVKRLALVLAVQAEIEGMKADNLLREQIGYSPAYGDVQFCEKAEELRNLAHSHDHQL